jgi:trehalose/maltose hydrolase-like predicted phosphorylase
VLQLDPHIPPHWTSLRFSITHHGTPLTVTITADAVTLEAHVGSARFSVPGHEGSVTSGSPVRLTRSETGWRAAA